MAQAVADACRDNGAAVLLAASSAAVYAPSAVPVTEEATPAPATPNGRSKLETEGLLARNCAEGGVPLVLLRIGNVVGADALFGPRAPESPPIRLDPVPGRDGGPVRSWIGPRSLGQALARLCLAAGAGDGLPPLLNLAQDPPLAMADLLAASGLPWAYGPPNPSVLPDAVLSTERLRHLVPLPRATAAGLLAELRALAPGRLP